MKNIFLKINVVVLIVLFSTLPLFLGAYYFIFNEGFYSKGFSKYGVYDKFENLDEYNSQVLDYLQGKNEMPSSILLNEQELVHMRDVKHIFTVFSLVLKMILILLLILLSLQAYFDKDIWKSISKVSFFFFFFSIAISLVLLIVFYFGFSSSFTVFHNLFFEEGSWLFYSSDNLVNIYPSGLFFDIFIGVFLLGFFISTVFIASGYTLRKKFIKRKS